MDARESSTCVDARDRGLLKGTTSSEFIGFTRYQMVDGASANGPSTFKEGRSSQHGLKDTHLKSHASRMNEI